MIEQAFQHFTLRKRQPHSNSRCESNSKRHFKVCALPSRRCTPVPVGASSYRARPGCRRPQSNPARPKQSAQVRSASLRVHVTMKQALRQEKKWQKALAFGAIIKSLQTTGYDATMPYCRSWRSAGSNWKKLDNAQPTATIRIIAMSCLC